MGGRRHDVNKLTHVDLDLKLYEDRTTRDIVEKLEDFSSIWSEHEL